MKEAREKMSGFYSKRFLAGLMTGILLFCVLSPVYAAFQIPEHRGYVTDLAGLMSPEAEARVGAVAEELDTKTHAQIAVLIIPREQLGDIPVEDAALETARKWGVGSKREGNTGLLVFMAVSDKPGQSKLRTEIGYGLEGIITDGTSGMIQDDFMVPAFRHGNFDAGIVNGVGAYATLIAREHQVELASLTGEAAPRNLSRQPRESAEGWGGSALGILIIMVMIALAFVSMLGHLFRSPYDRRRQGSHMDDGGILPWLILLGSMGGGGHRGGGFGGDDFGGFGGGGFGGGGSSRNW